MALVSCPECDQQVSDKAVACPKCAYPMQQEGSKQSHKQQSAHAESVPYEFKHIQCLEGEVNKVLRLHQLFYWEAISTNTVVSRDSHIERGPIPYSLSSVTITERFATIDFRRDKRRITTELSRAESGFFSNAARLAELGCSPADDYATPPAVQVSSWEAFLHYALFVFPLFIYIANKREEHRAAIDEWRRCVETMNGILEANVRILNV